MRKFIIPALITFLAIAGLTIQASAQDSAMSAEKRDALIGQLENVLQELQSERSLETANEGGSGIRTASANEVQGDLSANNLLGSSGSYSNLGSSVGGGYATGSFSTGAVNNGGYSTGSVYNGGGSAGQAIGQPFGFQALPVQGFAAAQPMQQQAPFVQAAPAFQQGPINVGSQGPLPNITLPTINVPSPAPIQAPAPIIFAQQQQPAPQQTIIQYVPTPVFQAPMPQQRRHKCCLFGR